MERHRETVELPAARIEVERVGGGPPLVLLQSAEAYEAGLDLVDRLAGDREVFLPWAPGYGGSPLPETFTFARKSSTFSDVIDPS